MYEMSPQSSVDIVLSIEVVGHKWKKWKEEESARKLSSSEYLVIIHLYTGREITWSQRFSFPADTREAARENVYSCSLSLFSPRSLLLFS